MPQRRCVGCGRVAPKSELVRLASVDGSGDAPARVTIDIDGRLPGRGAYVCRERGDSRREQAAAPSLQASWVHARRECLRLAQRRNAFARAFRQAVDIPAEIVESMGR